MFNPLNWLLKASIVVFCGLLYANPTQILLAKNSYDHKTVWKSKLLDPENLAKSSLTDKKNLNSLIRQRNHETSIQIANDIAYGLTVAQDKGQIKYGTKTYRKVQTAIALLRRGAGLDGASRRSGISRSLLDQLMLWGRQRPGALVDHVLD